MHTWLTGWLICPDCHADLDWKITAQSEHRILSAQATCRACGSQYPIIDGIGLFLTPDLPRIDMWEQADSGMAAYFSEHPDQERQLLEKPVTALNPADLFFRAMLLESRGEFLLAKKLERQANQKLYTREYINCSQKQIEYVLQAIADRRGPVVDLACGRGYLVEQILRRFERAVVATDFSPQVLRRNQAYFSAAGLHDQLSLIACDARRMPFRDGILPTLTTNIGLPNIENPGALLTELRRVTGGTFFAISQFYPPDDTLNGDALRQHGLEALLYRESALKSFRAAGWQIDLAATCTGRAEPTPSGEILSGAQVDGLPVSPTDLEWAVLVAKP